MTLDEALAGLRDAIIPPPPTTTLDEVQAQIMQVYADWEASAKEPADMQALSTLLREMADTTQTVADDLLRARLRFVATTRALDEVRLKLLLAGHTFTPPEKT